MVLLAREHIDFKQNLVIDFQQILLWLQKLLAEDFDPETLALESITLRKNIHQSWFAKNKLHGPQILCRAVIHVML